MDAWFTYACQLIRLDELDGTVPYTYRDRERRLQLRNALDPAW